MDDNLGDLPNARPVYAAPSLMSVQSCFVVPSSGQMPAIFYQQQPLQHQNQNNQALFTQQAQAQSQPQLSHSYSQPFLGPRASNSADHLVSASLNQLNMSSAAVEGHNTMTLPFHEQVKNSAHRLPVVNQTQQNSITAVCNNESADVNVVGTAVRIQVSALFVCSLSI